MRLVKARIQNYRSIIDTGLFDVEKTKTIMVGPNEAGKTAILQALQQINPPPDVPKFDALRDYPRAKFNDITTNKVLPENVKVVEAHFALEQADLDELPEGFADCTYIFWRKLDNKAIHDLRGGPQIESYGNLHKDLIRLCSHIDPRLPAVADDAPEPEKPSELLDIITKTWNDNTKIEGANAKSLLCWLDKILPLVDEGNETEEKRFDKLKKAITVSERRDKALATLNSRLPVLVLFNNYFRVKPLIHLDHLATRIETKVLDDAQYDYGNQCLLKLLGFTARELSTLGKTADPPANNPTALKNYRDQLDKRSYQLNAASVRLTDEICGVWSPDPSKDEADRLRVQADGQYLKVVVEDDLGVEIELDQRSEGFQWLVSFFVVFFAEAVDKHENAILLLDEPGLSLHGLKQREFRNTISKLAEKNQTLYTTHSPFLVGPDELDIVRVVEMTDRRIGTTVHTTISAGDPAAMLPLQEALGYDLAQSLFTQQRNLVLEGLTDYWYLDVVAQLLREGGVVTLNDKIALVPAASAGKVVYYATILHAQKLKVAALLDSDSAGDQAAQQENLVHTLGNKAILRTKDVYSGDVNKPEIEDLLRETLVQVAKSELGWDVENTAGKQMARPIVEVFAAEVTGFSKYKLAKAFLSWARAHESSDLTPDEIKQWTALIERINKALK
ncbi:MAG: AAA family ATPase [Desulfuromonadaceae bacterium]|nr:AAA family ATPase [Desulfuromonadaceae bacterium]MDD5104790.1 AAA family ATPase [Desulfuromonadaceae bacterium]